ncbi:sensor domain-containing diguanylate cyclase [Nocardia sp. NBC_00565]|uniref:sensor domain-containing diguanylate cyclase n=1 Tax=Nocardia sp. NBC_00565 TaxID=2975993 RepID=UPI002E81C7C8|nr:sensor domain-containing diguanylate cyclase [Nocardia sp. NBC_00565]WUC05869.1 sensor domain-containing diguanylate cyclase [Nocardia sp. NBC_00565]
MEEPQRSALASQWWQALTSICQVPMSARPALHLLGELVDQLATGLDADPFDTTPGVRAGQTLATTMSLPDPGVPIASAQVLYTLAEQCTRDDADQRIAALLTALGQGHQMQLSPTATPEQSAGRAADRRFRIVFDNAAVAIAISDIEGRLVDANQRMADMFGVPVEALVGKSVHHFAHPDDVDEIGTLIFDKLVPAREGTVKLERRAVRDDGSIVWSAFSVTYVKGTGGDADYLLGVGEDVTERHRLQQELHWQARHDQLTSLPNRRHLLERIQAIVAAAAHDDDHLGLCFTDLDRFKEINDRYGHAVGDQVLVATATRLRDSLQGTDCMIARIGGDEFVVLVSPPTDDRRVTAVADTLLSALVEPIIVGERQLYVSASIGAVVARVADAPAEALLDAADRGLYHAKTSSEHRWILRRFEPRTDP